MKNIFIGTLVLSCFFSIFRAEAQENFYRDILVSEETVPESVDEEAAADAVEQAKRLLNTRPQALRKQNFPQLRQRIKKPSFLLRETTRPPLSDSSGEPPYRKPKTKGCC